MLNALPGPTLTEVDVAQRLRNLREQPYISRAPAAPLEADALAAYAEEKAKGTEFIALLGYIARLELPTTARRPYSAPRGPAGTALSVQPMTLPDSLAHDPPSASTRRSAATPFGRSGSPPISPRAARSSTRSDGGVQEPPHDQALRSHDGAADAGRGGAPLPRCYTATIRR